MAFRALKHIHFYGGEVKVKREQGRSYFILDSLIIGNLDVHRRVEDNAVRGLRLMLEHGPENKSWKKRKHKIRTSNGYKPIGQLDMQDVCSYFHKARDSLKTLYENHFGMDPGTFKARLDAMNLARNARDHGEHLIETKHGSTSQRRYANVVKFLDTVDAVLKACVQKKKNGIGLIQLFLENNAGLRVTLGELLNVSRCQRSFQDMRERFDFETQKQVTVNLLSDLIHVIKNGNEEELQKEIVSIAHLMMTRQNPNARPAGLERWGCGLDVGAPRGYYTEFLCDQAMNPPPPPPAPAPVPVPAPALPASKKEASAPRRSKRKGAGGSKKKGAGGAR